MAGQPQILDASGDRIPFTPYFDVTGVQVTSAELTPSTIVGVGETFAVSVTFEGLGSPWEDIYTDQGYEFWIRYYIDDLTGYVPEELLRESDWRAMDEDHLAYAGLDPSNPTIPNTTLIFLAVLAMMASLQSLREFIS